jgi:hypothetical protein
MSQKTSKPVNYPWNSASGIYDAGAFTVGKSTVMHKPTGFRPHDDHYIGGTVVSAPCGVYGFTGEGEGREAVWSGGVGEGFHAQSQCTKCWGL